MSDDSLADLREAAGDGAPLVDLADLAGVSVATLQRWQRWANSEDAEAPPTPLADFPAGILSPAPALGDGENPEHVRAVVAAIREGRRTGRSELQRERRAIIEGERQTGDGDRLRAIERALADLAD